MCKTDTFVRCTPALRIEPRVQPGVARLPCMDRDRCLPIEQLAAVGTGIRARRFDVSYARYETAANPNAAPVNAIAISVGLSMAERGAIAARITCGPSGWSMSMMATASRSVSATGHDIGAPFLLRLSDTGPSEGVPP